MTEDLRRFIDHTCLRPDATAADIVRLCEEAALHGFYSVCVASSWVALASRCLAGCDVRIGSVVGFPHGNNLTVVKGVEAQFAIATGASEVDMVMNIGAFRGGAIEEVVSDIKAVVGPVRQIDGGILKVILETSLLSDEEIVSACGLAVSAGADFVKTSTGFGGGGASEEHVRLMRASVPEAVGVKAAGGIRDARTARLMLAAGATRLGTSASLAIIGEPKA